MGAPKQSLMMPIPVSMAMPQWTEAVSIGLNTTYHCLHVFEKLYKKIKLHRLRRLG